MQIVDYKKGNHRIGRETGPRRESERGGERGTDTEREILFYWKTDGRKMLIFSCRLSLKIIENEISNCHHFNLAEVIQLNAAKCRRKINRCQFLLSKRMNWDNGINILEMQVLATFAVRTHEVRIRCKRNMNKKKKKKTHCTHKFNVAVVCVFQTTDSDKCNLSSDKSSSRVD